MPQVIPTTINTSIDDQRPFIQILLFMVLGNTARSKNFIAIFLYMLSFILQFFTIIIVILYLSLLFA